MYKLVLLICLVFFACKNDAPVQSQEIKIQTPINREKMESPQSNATVQVNQNTPAAVEEDNNEPQGEPNTVTVSTVEELVANAKSNTTIYLEKGTYVLETDKVYYMTKDERRIINKREEESQNAGGQLYFNGLNNFQLIGKSGAQIVSKNPDAVVVFMVKGKNLKVSNLSIKNESDSRFDLGYFSNNQNVELDRCKFVGGGAYGIYVSNTEVMKINNSLISGITKGAVRILNSRGVTFMNTTISNNNPSIPLVNFYATGSYVTFKNVSIIDNRRNPASTFQNSERLFAVGNNTMILEDCTIQNNAGYKTLGVGPNNVKRCQIRGVSVP